ncbi:MAG: TonB-dependent receptor [Bacteroidia bacterium]|nr:TonB-dependent receptor [Bacteroidia bacterium]MBT8277631.1 TonB-dependent receptor [Bacteroidia bacterium]NND25189.1 TonB-dependent receptor [Flavobacteriaceae bacterium]NNL31941.1 TonB-dependent receptor [Flavobacteriaceae bacterium]RZW55402.1 MAG: TonB-dependent receptor [Flavobacteriaceae bacterium]
MKKTTQFLLLSAALLFSVVTMAQSTITGTVVGSDLNAPLPGANVIEKGTKNGTTTDFDGKFTLKTDAASGQVVISFVGYEKMTMAFNGNTDLGTITISPDNTLDEVVITGTGIIDLAEDRQTPVAVSTIKAAEIQKKIGAQDITTALVNTPSVYVAGLSGGFGDSRIAVRGFEQDNTAFLLNGQPINSMEDGRMFWSNWSGMNDVASAIQIQRGLGSSKLAISSVGGTVNFVTKSTDRREGGFVYAGIANDDYLKTTYSYSTGRNDKGWGTSFMLSHWQGDGYNEGTFGQGQTYFFSVGYTPNDKHNLNFLITGAPQWHDQNFSKSIQTYLDRGLRYNNNWGMYGNQYLTERRNFYHKPVANLNWDFNVNETTNLSTVLYASWGRGGGTGNRGNRIRTAEGRIDYNAIYAYNESVPGGTGGYFTAGGGYVTRSSMNLHSWYGLVSNLEKKLGENVTLNVGFDLRTYYGEHFRIVENFHGLNSWQENIRLRDQNNDHQTYGSFGTYKNVITMRDMAANPWTVLFAKFDEDEKIAYSNDERISYGGFFAQMEYAKDDVSVFFQGAASNQWHQRFDYYQYADQALIDGTSSQNVDNDNDGNPDPLPAGIEPGVNSEKISNFGFNVKGGGSYTINEDNKVYVNAGYYSRQPYHDNIYLNFTNQVNPLTENEKILGLEAGYSFKSQFFSANLNLYRTSWKDRVVTSSSVVDDQLQFSTNFGVEQVHQGIELDFTSKPLPQLRINGFLSIGDWVFKGEGVTQITDEEQNVISTDETDFDGGKVGDAAQFTAGIGTDVQICENFSWDADYRFYDNLYADVGAVKENLELPSYGVADTGLSYKMLLGRDKMKSLSIRANINNVFDNEYISELRTNIAAEAGDDTYEGINTANQGYFGLGRTWNLGLRYKF